MRITGKLYLAREMARLARCSLAQLEYLNEIRLLVPKQSSVEGHDRYDDINLLRLQQIRMGRARGLALEEIRRWLDGCPHGAFSETPTSRALTARQPAARTPLYVETEVKVATDEDCLAFQREAAALYAALSVRRRSGVASIDASLRVWAARHCLHINRWYFPCEDVSRHVAFGRAMVNNPYHQASIERHGRHLSSFLVSVLEAQAT